MDGARPSPAVTSAIIIGNSVYAFRLMLGALLLGLALGARIAEGYAEAAVIATLWVREVLRGFF